MTWRRCRPWTPDENALLVRMRTERKTIEACAFELRRSTSDVRRHMIVLVGLLSATGEHRQPVDWTEAENDRFLELWNAGESATNMAIRFGRSSRAIYSHAKDLRERGVDISRRHWWALDPVVSEPEPEPEPIPVPVAVAPLAPAGFAVYAGGISDCWDDDRPIGAVGFGGGR